MKRVATIALLVVLSLAIAHADDLRVSIRLNKTQDQLFIAGERVRITVEATQQCFLHVIYHDASGASYLIYPNAGSSPDGKIDGGTPVTLGQGVDVDGFEFEVTEPFGAELIRAYASTKPLPRPKGKQIDGALKLTSNLEGLQIFYHSASREKSALLTDATVLLKTAQSEHRSAEEEIQPPPTATPGSFSKPRIFALVVGVSAYRSPKINPLQYADKDAEAFAEFLSSPSGGAVPKDQMRLLLNENATRENILREMREFLTQTKKNDLLVLYIAAHGLTSAESNATYVLSTDAELKNLAATAVDQAEITAILTERVKAGKIVFFIDACHGGALGLTGVRLRGASSFLSSKLMTELVTKKNGTAFFSAARAMEQSMEGVQWGNGHGVFTFYLLEGLKKKADADGNGIVTITELDEYVSARVKSETGGKQHPELKGYFDNDLSLSVVK